MCGIIVYVCKTSKLNTRFFQNLSAVCDRRGPDFQMTKTILLANSEDSENDYTVNLRGSVLHLRGPETIQQPIQLGVKENQCDTSVLVQELLDTRRRFTEQALSNEIAHEASILHVLSKIRGEWATVIWENRFRRLWFGRDYLGRRSLLWKWGVDSSFSLTSTSESEFNNSESDDQWEEVPANGIYCLDLSTNIVEKNRLKHFPWIQNDQAHLDGGLSSPCTQFNTQIPEESYLTIPSDHPTPLALSHQKDADAVARLFAELSSSVQKRVETIPTPIENVPRLGILFSGGLDCMCLAALAHSYVPENEAIDLLNVSFENPRIQKARQNEKLHKKHAKGKKDVETSVYEVPDRITGRLSVEELKRTFPGREWRFVEIDVPFEEATEYKAYIQSLMIPLQTVMDLSIAMAFWFASRGRGFINESGVKTPYQSRAKVLFSGLGADEQMGGYGRHTVSYRKSGWQGILDEIKLDVERIASRNLGRDDRIVSDHGKEVRFPFLDESVVSYLSSLPINLKVDPRFEKGIGEKIILRRLANEKLKISRVSTEPKRAVQFGARSARMVDTDEKGTDAL
ncbi:Asparagine synthetase domain-containing protein 1 [Nowakowskiella sp. JEL0407]|nr:Asparagine synthetase domain-containing protein 1 [Nowakowskiella sp. JEL0407]